MTGEGWIWELAQSSAVKAAECYVAWDVLGDARSDAAPAKRLGPGCEQCTHSVLKAFFVLRCNQDCRGGCA